jgi:hypothetical protein
MELCATAKYGPNIDSAPRGGPHLAIAHAGEVRHAKVYTPTVAHGAPNRRVKSSVVAPNQHGKWKVWHEKSSAVVPNTCTVSTPTGVHALSNHHGRASISSSSSRRATHTRAHLFFFRSPSTCRRWDVALPSGVVRVLQSTHVPQWHILHGDSCRRLTAHSWHI